MIPPDPVLQRMTDDELQALWSRRPRFSESLEWVRVAKEIRHRNRVKRPQGPSFSMGLF